TPSTSQPPNTHPTPDVEEAVPMPHESPLYSVHSLGCDEGSLSLNELTDLCTYLSKKVEGLESELKQTKQTYVTALTKLIKNVKKLEQTVKSTQARRRFRIVVYDNEESLEDPSKQGRKISEIDQDPSISLVQDERTSWIQEDIEIQEKISDDTEVVLEEEEPTELVEDQSSGEKGEKEVSTVDVEHSTVILEPEPEKKTKKQLELERLRHKEAVRLQEQLNEEETQRIARDAEIARHLHKEINKAGQERVVTKDDQAYVIDWSDPAVLRYHAQLNRPYSVAEVRKNMVMTLKNQEGYKMNYFKGTNEKKGNRKKSLVRKRGGEKQSEESTKRQKIEDDIEKEELKAYLDLTHVLTENFMYYQIIRANGSSKNYKIFSEMLDDFDRQDVLDLHRLIKERYATSRPEGYDLMLWGDLKILFQPNEEDEV
ncbi:hypothetical protein Tco_1438006, partial [Tanacetum coccineum]